ncbi:hypothetical protein [Aureispira anguillae]|uniref:Lipoprotein n=1 Tax=Aureispira anguillae TaxID=2864201 RepID=A0A915YC47_9BACT|nr:hypothetical protein [Aureispira anguillae]BDS10368.1 hypothetical protein AsAng_0010760 [Aureispira anguillae]
MKTIKIIALCFILVSGILGLSFSCCSDRPEYWNLTNFQVTISDQNYMPPHAGQIKADTLLLLLDFEIEYLAAQSSSYKVINPFINTMYATSCPPYGEKGMKDQLVHINLSSSADFNTYPAGISLTPLLTIWGHSVEDWIEKGYFNETWDNRWELRFNEKPSANSNLHDFKISLTFASGRKEEVQLGAIAWN